MSARRGKNCSAGCPTKDHKSWGECVRSKGLRVSPQINDQYAAKQKAWDSELNSYEAAVRQGVQPEGTTAAKVSEAMQKAEASA